MKKIILTSLMIISTFFCMSQHFEWASVGTYIFHGFNSSVIDHNGNIIVLGRAIYPNIPHGKPYIYDAKGKPYEINAANNPSLIISYSPFGE